MEIQFLLRHEHAANFPVHFSGPPGNDKNAVATAPTRRLDHKIRMLAQIFVQLTNLLLDLDNGIQFRNGNPRL